MTAISAQARQAAGQSPCLDAKAQKKFFALATRALGGETVTPHPRQQATTRLVADISESFDDLPIAEHLQFVLVDAPLNRVLAYSRTD